jgi:hypothetical protein
LTKLNNMKVLFFVHISIIAIFVLKHPGSF